MSSEPSGVESALMSLLRNKLGVQHALVPGTALIADLGLESIQVIEFLCEVEDHFDLAIDEDSLADVHTIADLAAVVVRIGGK